MPAAALPPDEPRRLAALHALNILDTEREERFDRITRLAQRLFEAPMVTGTPIDSDRGWFKSECGVGGEEDSREVSFCSHAILEPEQAEVAVGRLAEALEARNATTGEPFGLSLSIGLGVSEVGDETPLAELVAIADQAMLGAKRAKKAGRDGAE